MNKDVARLLSEKAQEVGQKYSDPARAMNTKADVFFVGEIIPLSEYAACVVYCKGSGKKAAAFFYWINQGSGYWTYFFPTDSHIMGMEMFGQIKFDVEKHNFKYNFEEAV